MRLLPGAEHVVVEEAGHVIMLEHPEVLNQQFLALVERARRAAHDHPIPERSAPVRLVDMSSRRAAREAQRQLRKGR